MAQVKCPQCKKMLDVDGFGGAVKCPNCAFIFPYAAEKRVRCPHCNRLTKIQDVRGMEFKCSHCRKSIYYNKSGDITSNLSDVAITITNVLGIVVAVIGWIISGSSCVCGSIILVLFAIDIYFGTSRRENKPEVILGVKLIQAPSEDPITKKLPIIDFFAYIAKADGEFNPREQEFMRWILENILRNVPGETETQLQQDIISALQYIKDYVPHSPQELLAKAQALKPFVQLKVATDLIEALCDLSIADGSFDQMEQQFVKLIGSGFGINPQTIESIIFSYAERGKKRTTSEAQGDVTLREAYAILGLSVDASFQDVKARYRELAKRYHPDKQAGKSEADKIHAEEMMKLISRAYRKIEQEK